MRKLISIVISLLVMGLLYSFLDLGQIRHTISSANLEYLLSSLILLIALVALSGVRLLFLCSITGMNISFLNALEATFVASTLNLVLPGKTGDVFKATTMVGADSSRIPQAIALGVWEKISELTLLLLIGVTAFAITSQSTVLALAAFASGVLAFGLLLYWPRPRNKTSRLGSAAMLWSSTLCSLRAAWPETCGLLLMSLLIWIGHVLQICMMAAALGVCGDVSSWLAIAARIPVAVLAGLVPLTFMGIGPRDGALIVLLQPFMPTDVAAALGVLFWLRYLVPGIIGLPLLPRYIRLSSAHAQKLRRSQRRS